MSRCALLVAVEVATFSAALGGNALGSGEGLFPLTCQTLFDYPWVIELNQAV